MIKEDIRSYSLRELKDFLNTIGYKSFVANQIFEWLYNKNCSSFDSMTNLSKSLREKLKAKFIIQKSCVIESYTSRDDSTKLLLNFGNADSDTNKVRSFFSAVECVAIPSVNNKIFGLTACVSSQIGCGINCQFCATGQQGFTRNLTASEIIEQVQKIEEVTNREVSNIVFMGQGEPFMNYHSLLTALNIFNNHRFFDIGARKITVSTCGIVPKIYEFAKIHQQYRLAISLHSAVQTTRDFIMPGVKKYNLEALKYSLMNYQQIANRRITIEYLMLKNINDDNRHLSSLLKFCRNLNCYINLIPYNSVNNSSFEASPNNVINNWGNKIKSSNIKCSVRKSKAQDISGACGQLRNSYSK